MCQHVEYHSTGRRDKKTANYGQKSRKLRVFLACRRNAHGCRRNAHASGSSTCPVCLSHLDAGRRLGCDGGTHPVCESRHGPRRSMGPAPLMRRSISSCFGLRSRAPTAESSPGHRGLSPSGRRLRHPLGQLRRGPSQSRRWLHHPGDRLRCALVGSARGNPSAWSSRSSTPRRAGVPERMAGRHPGEDLEGPIKLPPTVDENLAANHKPAAHVAMKGLIDLVVGPLATPAAATVRDLLRQPGRPDRPADRTADRLLLQRRRHPDGPRRGKPTALPRRAHVGGPCLADRPHANACQPVEGRAAAGTARDRPLAGNAPPGLRPGSRRGSLHVRRHARGHRGRT